MRQIKESFIDQSMFLRFANNEKFKSFCECKNQPVLNAALLHWSNYCCPSFQWWKMRLMQSRNQTNYPLFFYSNSCNLSLDASCSPFVLSRNVRWSWTTRRVTAATLWTATFSATPATWRTSSQAAPPPSPPLPTNAAAGGGRHLVELWSNYQSVIDSRAGNVQFLL